MAAADSKKKRKKKKKKSGGTPFRESPFFKLVWIVPIALVVLAIAGVLSRMFLGSASGQEFLAKYPGHSELPAGTPEGFPWWAQWQHFFNIFLMVLIIRSGWLVRVQQKPDAYWTRTVKKQKKGAAEPTKMSIYLWLHLSLDVLWLLNGFIFVILLFASGHWARVVPVSWDIFPNMISAGLQYLSFDWPAEMAWVNYNALQVMAYFVTIFIAAPLAAISGVRMSPIWQNTWPISKAYPAPVARAIHLPVMFYFVGFIFIHVLLVFTTGMRHNLNMMFSWTGDNATSWWGFIMFAIAMIVVAAGWIAARPMFMQAIAGITGKVTTR